MTGQSRMALSDQILQDVSSDVLTPLVQQVLNRANCDIYDWQMSQVHGGAGDRGAGLSGIFRFSGQCRDRDENVAWSLILKVIGEKAQGGDPNGGIREALAYQSGQLNGFPGNFRPAQCFNVSKRNDGSYWLWLEDLKDVTDGISSLADFEIMASHLGQFNGHFAMKERLPDWPWLSRDWLRDYITPNEPHIERLRKYLAYPLEYPLVQRQYPSDVAEGLFQLWEDREIFLNALDRLPKTLCHRDATFHNLFIDIRSKRFKEIVAIDWAFVGLGNVGEEISPLVQFHSMLQPEKAEVLDASVYNSYLKGLRLSGWTGNTDTVRFSYAASSALRYGLGLIGVWLDRLVDSDEKNKASLVKEVFGRSIEENAKIFPYFYRFQLKLINEARRLFDSI